MRHPFVARQEDSLLLIIDIQQAMTGVIAHMDDVLRRTQQLVAAADVLNIPILVTEQYKQGLGATIPELRTGLEKAIYFQKEHFSACLEEKFVETVRNFGRRQIIVVGVEAHVCVLQTGLDLIGNGYQLQVVGNAVSSRFAEDRQAGLDLFRRAGAVITTAEIVIFQWTRRANTPTFKQILPIVK